MDEDISNLRKFVDLRDPQAFAAVVNRYINVVYAAARRQVRDSHLAEDVTQAVFIVLSQKIAAVPTNRPLSAWLLKVTSYVAANAMRARRRRRDYENGTIQMRQTISGKTSEDLWNDVSPLLDEGLAKLKSADRDLLLWRFFESRSVGQIAQMLEVSEDAAGKRLARAVEKLRDFFRRRGVTTTDATLTTLLATKIIEPAPASLVGASSGSAAASAHVTALAKSAGVIMSGAPAKLAIAAMVVALVVSGGGVIAYKSVRQVASNVLVAAPAAAEAKTAPSPPPRAAQDFTQELLVAKEDCFPDEVITYLLSNRPKEVAAKLDASADVMTQPTSVDQTARRWIGLPRPVQPNMGKEIDLGLNSANAGIGVVTDLGAVLPVRMTPTQEKGLSLYRMAVELDQNWTGDEKSFVVLFQGEELRPTGDQTYQVRMQNYPLKICVQQLLFVAPKGWKLVDSSAPPASADVVGDFTVYLWQAKIATVKDHFEVDIKLRRENDGTTQPSLDAAGK